MGIYAINNPGRAGADVAKFNGWRMYAIINHFVNEKDLTDMETRIQLKRALLISDEYTKMGMRASINV